MKDQQNRLYVAQLLNRADQPFEARDLAMIATVLELVEADMADWLDRQLRETVSRGIIVAAVRNGLARPALEGEAA